MPHRVIEDSIPIRALLGTLVHGATLVYYTPHPAYWGRNLECEGLPSLYPRTLAFALADSMHARSKLALKIWPRLRA